jgi:ABC-type antimicrobial peptide transport system permease subunit
MTNARGPSSERREETTGGDACVCSIGNTVEHYVTGILGLVATLVVGVQAYPWLQSAAEAMSYLGSTWLVFSLAAIWLVCWIALEVAWEWRAGRVHLL